MHMLHVRVKLLKCWALRGRGGGVIKGCLLQDSVRPDQANLMLPSDGYKITRLHRRLLLSTDGGAAPAVVKERLWQWQLQKQQAIQEQLEMEQKIKPRKQRSVWWIALRVFCGTLH
jgi:hypothetical protein